MLKRPSWFGALVVGVVIGLVAGGAGADVEILAPHALRARMAANARALGALYVRGT